MPDVTTSANVDTLMQSADFAAFRTSLGLTALATTTPGTGVATFLATPSSANLAAAVTGETGTGALVFGSSPTIDAPTLTGTTTADTVNTTTGNVTTLVFGGVTITASGTELNFTDGVTSAIQTQLDGKQPLDSDLTSWAAITRASGFDTFVATPSGANLGSLLTSALTVAKGGTGLTSGTSGGVLAFTASGTIASSGALTANALVIGGGAGVAPSTTTTGTGVLTQLALAADGSATDGLGFRGAPQNSQTASYTTVMADSGKCIFHPSSDNNARTFTIDSNANVAFPVGTIIEFLNMAAASCTIAITSDTLTLLPAGTTGSRTLAQYGRASVEKISSTAWVISGNSALT